MSLRLPPSSLPRKRPTLPELPFLWMEACSGIIRSSSRLFQRDLPLLPEDTLQDGYLLMHIIENQDRGTIHFALTWN